MALAAALPLNAHRRQFVRPLPGARQGKRSVSESQPLTNLGYVLVRRLHRRSFRRIDHKELARPHGSGQQQTVRPDAVR